MTVLSARRRMARRLPTLAFAVATALTAACSGERKNPAAPELPGTGPVASFRPNAFVADINTHTGEVKIAAPTINTLESNPSLSLAGGGSGPDLSLLGGEAVRLIPSNYHASAVGEFAPGKVRVTFDVVIENKLPSVKFITPTWPAAPAPGVILFPLEAVVTTTSGGVTGGDGNEVVVELPSHGNVVPSADWNGTGAAGSGAPFNFFNDADCGLVTSNDCFRWEAYDAEILPAPATSSVRTIGFDIDPTVGQFRARMVVAADLAPAGIVTPPAIKINEAESNGGTPGDWVELYNPTTETVNISGWVFKDNDDTHAYALPTGSTIAAGGYFLVEEAAMGFGLGSADATRLFNASGVLIDSYNWTAHAATTYGRCPNGTGAFTTTTTSTKGAANDCSVPPPAIKINEVESNGGTPGDWIELYNAGATVVDLSGYVVKDNDDTHNYTLPVGTTIAPGTYLVVEEAALGFGLGAADAARLFSPTTTLIDSYTWTAHATTTYGRCPNGSGAFATTVSSTKGIANSCTPTTGPVVSLWPGNNAVQTADGTSVFGSNLSGLTYEGANGSNPAVLWAVRNGPGTLYRLIWNGTIWTPDAANGWTAGKAVHYTDGSGDADAEGVTYAEGGSAGGIYVSTERNNSANTISRPAVLLFDPSQSGTSLTATREWNLTSDLPAVGANLGLEGITWVPDSYLTSKGFFDEAANHAYTPADYPNHGTGLFFVGLEANGMIYAYALNHSTNGFTRVATISSGQSSIMDLHFDRELNYLWAECDDGCGGRTSTLEVDQTVGSPTLGRFVVTHTFERPSTMPNINNEGFTIAPQSMCVANEKPVFWSDDSETGGHSIRSATLPCTRFP